MRALLLALLLSNVPTQAGPQRAELQDSLGDTGFSPSDQAAPDLRSGSMSVQPEGGLALSVRFAKGTFDPVTTYVQFNLNLEQSGASPESCPQCGNYFVDINGVGPASRKAKVHRLVAGGRYDVVASVPIQFTADGADVAIPSSILPKDVTRLTLRVVACVRLGDDALSVILDRMPEADHAPVVLVVGRGRRTKS